MKGMRRFRDDLKERLKDPKFRKAYEGGVIFSEPKIKVTIQLNKSSLRFFKKEAQKNNTKYQRMIRAVLDKYVSHHK